MWNPSLYSLFIIIGISVKSFFSPGHSFINIRINHFIRCRKIYFCTRRSASQISFIRVHLYSALNSYVKAVVGHHLSFCYMTKVK